MKHHAIAPVSAPRADRSLRPLHEAAVATLTRLAMAGALAAIVPAALAGFATAQVAGGLAVALVTIGVGLVLGLTVARVLARVIARTIAAPVEMLLTELDEASDDGFRWTRGTALSRDDIRHDLELVERRTRQAARRTRQMLADLAEARDQASRQNLAKSQFLANMSHELRTPLNAILGYAMLLSEDAAEAGNPSALADLERIQNAGCNLLAIINDILDLARIETGGATIQRSVVDLDLMVQGLAEDVASESARRGNGYVATVAPEARILIGDQAKLRQCLANLLSNAFKFTAAGTVSLTVAAEQRDGRKWIRFTVADSGIGIAATEIATLFEAFHQIDGSATRAHGGTGLGLAIVGRLATLMGGECRVESVPGTGSTFTLMLPAGEPGEGVALPRGDAAVDATPQFHESKAGSLVALVIDDDEAAVELMRRWLARMGYSVLSTLDGETGVRLAVERRPDLILLDAFLPGRSGYELLGDLRRETGIADVPVILITVDDDRARGLRLGATDYLRKPVSEAQLRSVLDVYRGRGTGEVLIIDDDDDAAELLSRCVAQLGMTSRRACDGREGIAMAADRRPDAIVLDLLMPAMNGFGVLDRLAGDPVLSAVPLVVVSGLDLTLDQHRRLTGAGHRFLPKAATTPREIAQSLREIMA